MGYTALLIVLIIGFFFGLLILFEVGRRVGLNRMRRDTEGAHTGIAPIESAIFGLMGLLIGFTFFGGYQRFDYRRNLVVEETNRIGTAYVRLDLLPAETQPAVRQLFRDYVEARIEFYRDLVNEADATESVKVRDLQKRIWESVVAATNSTGAHPSAGLLLGAVNEMKTITSTRTLAMQMHPPMIVFLTLIGLTLASALLGGYQMSKAKQRNWIHSFGYALVMSVVIYVILDMEYPRMGLIRVNGLDQSMVDLRNNMN